MNSILTYAYYTEVIGMNKFGFRFILHLIRFVFTICSLYSLKVFGRKSLMLAGYLVACLCNCVLTEVYDFKEDDENNHAVVMFITIFTMIIFMVGYGLTIGSAAWVFMAETLPVRALGIVTC